MAASEWISFVKKVQAETPGMTYGEAMRAAAPRWKSKKASNGGKAWGLSPEQQKQYIEDKRTGKHQKKVGSMTVWDPQANGGAFIDDLWTVGKHLVDRVPKIMEARKAKQEAAEQFVGNRLKAVVKKWKQPAKQ